MSFLDDAWKGVKKVVRSPVTKVVAGGVAVVFPAVGVPAVAGLAIASKTIDNVDPERHAKTKAAAVKHATAAKVLAVRATQAKARGLTAEATALAAKAQQAQRSAVALGRKAKRMQHARDNLAKKLEHTRKLAAAGDHGASRALAVFELVSKAKAGDKNALAAAMAIRTRHNVGQAIRTHFQLLGNGRVVFTGGRVLGADHHFDVRASIGGRSLSASGTLAGDPMARHSAGLVAARLAPPPWVRDRQLWGRIAHVLHHRAPRQCNPPMIAKLYKRAGGRVA